MPQGTFEIVARELIEALKPLEKYTSSPEEFSAFIYRLGWGVTNVPPEYLDLAAAVVQLAGDVEDLVDDPQIGEVMTLIGHVKDVYVQIQDLSQAPTGVPAPEIGDFLAEITERLFEMLLVDYLANRASKAFNILQLFNVIKQEHIPADGNRPSFMRTIIDWAEIPKIFTEPDKLPEKVFGWGTAELKLDKFVSLLAELAHAIHAPVSIREVAENIAEGFKIGDSRPRYVLRIPIFSLNIAGTMQDIGVEILELPAAPGKLPGFIIQPILPSEIGAELRLREDIKLLIRASSNINRLFGITVRPGEIDVKYPMSGADTLPEVGFGIGFSFTPSTPAIIFGSPNSVRLQLKGATVSLDLRFTVGEPEIILKAALDELALVIAASDGFLATLLGAGEKKLDFSLGIEWSNKNGIKFTGGGGFEIATHPHLQLGPVTIEDLLIRLLGKVSPVPGISLEVGANIKGELGPLKATVQNIGITLTASFQGGNVGPFGLNVGFKPPSGVGLAIDAGGFKGGGFLSLDYEKGEYIGALELEFKSLFTLKAVGIINTKMPDGSSGFSLLILITAEFTPIQLGFGFTLNGVGGLLGLNRTVNVDVLRAGVKTNAIKHILFPENVVANINQIISDLKAIFPPQEGRFLIGPMAEIGWASFIKVQLGIILEIPVPRFIILGVIKAFLPTEDQALLKIQVNFLGVLDFENKYISFDASLYDSRLLVFTLTGDMAFRLSWGDNSVFILSVGGFHPAFQEAPADLRNMTRLGISLLSGENPRITIQCYFAVTSNTVQFGARAELYAEACGFNVYGYLGFDALFQFSPFYFIITFDAGFALRKGSSVICGIAVRGSLSGPTPWDVKGDASITILFFEISIGFHVTWGDPPGSADKPKEDLIERLKAEIAENSNWKAELPANSSMHVTLKKITLTEDKADRLIVHPFGELSFSERLVPLGIKIDKFGSKVPKDVDKFTIKPSGSDVNAVTLKEQFAPEQFFSISDSEKLSRPSFESMESGFKIKGNSAVVMPIGVTKSVDYEISYLRKKKFSIVFAGIYKLAKGLFQRSMRASAVFQSSMSKQRNKVSAINAEPVKVVQPEYAIANMSDLKLHGVDLQVGSYAEANAKLQELVAQDPALKKKIQIVGTHELNRN